MLKGGAGRLWTSGKTGGMGRRVQKGALGVEHTIKGSGGDFLMVLNFFFVWKVVLAARVSQIYRHRMGAQVSGTGSASASLPKRKLLSVSTLLRFSRVKNP